MQTGTSAPPLGRRVGRYELLAEIGRGGMGRVYCAQDVVLDRRVALKTLLRRDVSAIAEARIVREAQAMAQLAHPCVVPVYDVERTDDGLWIAMEYVPGCTLHRWLKQRRSTAEILAVFRDAGRGLEAAHAAGLVHRDFKPTNVLVGEDGRARVMDFGLARGDVAAETDPPGASSGSASPLVRDLTEQGTVLGTPSYMAPEQHRGLRADARADQYAFCTALFEALHGAHPFAAADRDAVQLVVAKHSSRFVAVGAAEVPPRIAAAIRRGLAPDPDARWPTMNDLLAELEPATRGRLRRWGLAAAALVLAGAGAFVVAGPDRARPSASVVATAPADRGPSLAAELAWLEGRLAVAEGDPNAARGRFELAWHTAFATGNDVLAARAAIDFLDVVGNTRGRTADALARAPEVESIVARVGDAALDARLERVMGSVLYGAGDTEGSQSRLHRAGVLLAGLADADPIELALVDDHVARNLHRNGAHDEARPLYDRSLERARAALGDGHPIVATILAHRSALAFDEGRFDEARALLERSLVVYERGPSLAHPGAAQLYNNLGNLERVAGRFEAARTAFERALAIWRAKFGEDDTEVAHVLDNLASVLGDLERYDEAVAHAQRALVIVESTFGPTHAEVASVRDTLGYLHLRRKDWPAALAQYEIVLEIWRTTYGDDHPDVGGAYSNVAFTALELGRIDDARRAYERAADIWERTLGPDHPALAYAYVGLARVWTEQNRPELARAPLERALAIRETMAADPRELATIRFDLARALWNDRGERRRAIALAKRSLADYRPLPGALADAERKAVQTWLARHRA